MRKSSIILGKLKLTLVLIGGLSVTVLNTAGADAGMGAARKTELEHLLRQDCGSCHGMTLKGGLGPALLPVNLEGKSDEFLVYTILEGRGGTAMPPWRELLSETEARYLVDLMRRGAEQ